MPERLTALSKNQYIAFENKDKYNNREITMCTFSSILIKGS